MSLHEITLRKGRNWLGATESQSTDQGISTRGGESLEHGESREIYMRSLVEQAVGVITALECGSSASSP